MSGIELTSEELQTIFDVLGLNENQSLVYFSLLSVGNLTIGQISQLTGLNYIQVRNAIEVLVGGEYIDWVPGKISRYYAREPFLKSFLLSYDTITLVSIQDSTSKKITALKKDLQNKIEALSDKLSGDDRNAVQEIYNRLQVQLELPQKEINKEVSALIYTIQEMKRRLDTIFQLSRKLSTSATEVTGGLTTELVFGETTFVLLLRDMVSRTKISVTICMPFPDIQTLVAASNLPVSARSRALIVGDFEKVPANILKRVTSSDVRLKQASVDYLACIRDNEEVLLGPIPQTPDENEEMTGIFSTNPSMIKFFGHQIQFFATQGSELKVELD